MGVHVHVWTTWIKAGALYDSLGAYIGPTRLEFSGGRPITGGWTRTCRTCGESEHTR